MTGTVVDRGDNLPEVVVPEVIAPEVPEVIIPGVPETPEVKEPAEPAPRDEKGKFIPLNRHEAVLGNERAARETAERKVIELQAQLKQVDLNASTETLESEIIALEKQQSKLLLDGDHEKAADVARDIRLKERTISAQREENMSQRAKNEAQEGIRFDSAVDTLESTYDSLNPAHADFDESLIEDVLGWQQMYITRDKMAPSAALIKAAQKVMVEKVAAPEVPPAEPGLAAGKVAGDRKTAQVEKNIAASKAQPASLKDSGLDSDKAGQLGNVDYTKLTAEERAALPAATKARLRGDIVE